MRTKEGVTGDEVRFQIVQHTRGRGVELARGPKKWYPHFIAVRERTDEKMPANVSPDLACNNYADGLSDFQDDSLDFVVARDDTELDDGLMFEIRRALKPGGKLVRHVEGYPPELMALEDGKFVDRLVYEAPAGKSVCVVRYGAIGDTIQATSVLDALKRGGYHITWMCEPLGHHLLKHDARIDAFLLQDKNQVPNHELPSYWAEQSKRFDRFINLCESVEGTLITLPGRATHRFPWALRHELFNKNYGEITAKIAELPFEPEHRFTPSLDEVERAAGRIKGIAEQENAGLVLGERWRKPFVILWALAGSSIHKTWAHMDAIVARIMLEIPHAHVIFTGDPACEILEYGWENEPRVHRLSGKLDIRDTLSLALQADMVIGPETGVMSAVAFEAMPKILFLSHSSVENLSKHWVNTTSLFTDVTTCYPCHQLHYTFEHCQEHVETGTAMCQHTITPDRAWEAVWAAYRGRETVNRILTA